MQNKDKIIFWTKGPNMVDPVLIKISNVEDVDDKVRFTPFRLKDIIPNL